MQSRRNKTLGEEDGAEWGRTFAYGYLHRILLNCSIYMEKLKYLTSPEGHCS